MKKIALFLIFSFSHFLIFSVAAQDSYLNDRLIATDDVNGTARYVGMGGAMGALGADMSVISSNPAGIGLFRKSDASITFGAVAPGKSNSWDKNDGRTNYEKLARASFDQMGFVWNAKVDNDKLRYLNVAFNYQKKSNYNMGFYADVPNLRGLSQMDQIAELAQAGYALDANGNPLNNLAGMAVANGYVSQDALGYYNPFRGDKSYYTRHQRGSSQLFDLNLSFNVNDRFYSGITFGLENVDYFSWSSYSELSVDANGTFGDYTLYNDRKIDGTGINAKIGFIVRPVEDNPFRIGLTVESPTWYRMKQSSLYDLTDDVLHQRVNTLESYIEYTVRTPWRARLSLGSTVKKYLAWGIEYEYANMAKTAMGYPTYDDDGYHNFFANTKDHAMNQLTKNVMRAQHSLHVGIEGKPHNDVALRLGYGFFSNRYKANPSLDQLNLDSRAMDYYTSTDFMTLGATNLLTAGVGYKHKHFYADIAYKYRMQDAKYYAFDTSFTEPGSDFSVDNPTLSGITLQPVSVPLNRHQVMLTLGYKF